LGDAASATRTLAGGVEIPRLGLGVWQVPAGGAAERAVSEALEVGYRHVDTAQGYGNEADVGRALAASAIPRERVFVTTKFRPAAADPLAELERSLERLGLERVDLYLVHWPKDDPIAPWPGMERALERGLTRAIGVSNYGVAQLEAVVASADAPPVVNQIELNPFSYRRRLVAACERLRVAPEAYSPLTTGVDLGHPVVSEVARRNRRSPAQVMLRWGIERGFVVVVKTVRRERMTENAAIFDFELADEELTALDGLDRTRGTGRGRERWWQTPTRIPRRLARRLGTSGR
jgi:diketogulonate reductase-like aldo/keto reductase